MTINKKTLYFILISIIIVLVVVIYFLANKNQKPATLSSDLKIITTNSDVKVEKTGTINIDPNLSFPEIDKSLPVYQAELKTINLVELATLIANTLQLEPSSQIPNTWISKDSSQFISVTPQTNSLLFLVNYYSKQEDYIGRSNPTKDGAISTAKSFQKQINFWSDLDIDLNNIKFIQATSEESKEDKEGEANAVQIPFVQKINSFPVYINDQLKQPLVITISQSNNIVRIDATNQYTTIGNKVNDFSTKSKEEIISDLKNNKASIIDIHSERPIVDPVRELGSIQIESVEIEYRLDPKTNTLLPFYKFTANTKYQDFDTKIFLVLPAVKI